MSPAREPSSTSRSGATDLRSLSRREVLRIGSMSLSASLLPGVAAAGDSESAAGDGASAKSVIFLWMAGGVTHLDSFDPKPEAPEEVRGTLGAIDTVLPGVQFSETMPRLARMADQLALVRSFSHDSNDHLLSQVYTLSGRKVTRNQLFSEPNIGSIISHLHGPRDGLPAYIAVPGITRPGPPPHNLFVGGWLGERYAPFSVSSEPDEPDFTKTSVNITDPSPETDEDLTPGALELPATITADRLMQRSQLRGALDGILQEADRSGVLRTADAQHQSALNLLLSPKVRAAFDLSKDKKLLHREYGRTKIGARCLLARRLVESGARFVMVDYGYDPEYGNLWDNHCAPSQNQPHISEMAKRGYHVAGIDRAFAALITDLKGRGLLESTLVVFLTEFGRTPKLNKSGARDHWPHCFSALMAGAGIPGGTIVGASDKNGAYPAERPVSPTEFAATIYQRMGIDTINSFRIRPFINNALPVGELTGA